MGFSQSFLYKAIDKITPILKRIDKQNEKTAKKTAKTFKKADEASKKATTSIKKQGVAVDITSKKWAKLGNKLKGVGKKLNSIGKSLTRKLAIPLVAMATMATVSGGNYEDALLSLSAITGISGKSLDTLSVKILKSSERWGIGSSKFAKGIELIGSKQPVLLKTPKLLLEVTNAAALMSKAAGMEFPLAADSLLSVMNAFVLPGEKAIEVVNMLAAASKYGSVQIPFVSEALKRFAGTARTMKVGIVEATAAVEILGEKTGRTAEVVGTGMRAALVEMHKKMGKFSPKIIGLGKSLEILQKKVENGLDIQKKFGTESAETIIALLENREALRKLKMTITGTNVASEQAAIRMRAFNHISKKLYVTIQNELIKVFLKYKDDIKAVAFWLINATKSTAAWVKVNPTLTKTILIMAGVIGPLAIVLGTVASIIGSITTIAPVIISSIVGIKIAVIALGVGLTAIAPILVPILAIVAAIAGATLFVKWISEATGLTNALANVLSNLFGIAAAKERGLKADEKAARLAKFRIKLTDIALIKNEKLRKQAIESIDFERRLLASQGVISGKRTTEELVEQRQKGLETKEGVVTPREQKIKSFLDVNLNVNDHGSVFKSIMTSLKGDGNVTIGKSMAGA